MRSFEKKKRLKIIKISKTIVGAFIRRGLILKVKFFDEIYKFIMAVIVYVCIIGTNAYKMFNIFKRD